MALNEHFDTESLSMLREVMEEEFDDLLALFVTDAEERLPKMKSAVQQQQADELMGMAHSFKGASGNVCAAPLSALNRDLEDSIRSVEGDQNRVDWTATVQLLDKIEQEYQAVRGVIENEF